MANIPLYPARDTRPGKVELDFTVWPDAGNNPGVTGPDAGLVSVVYDDSVCDGTYLITVLDPFVSIISVTAQLGLPTAALVAGAGPSGAGVVAGTPVRNGVSLVVVDNTVQGSTPPPANFGAWCHVTLRALNSGGE